jgi:hypothetical protein
MKGDDGKTIHERADDIDWRMYAPRWLLVVLAAGFCTISVFGLRRHVEGTEHTAHRVGLLEKSQESTNRAIRSMAVQIAQTRVDSLRWQIHSSNRLGDRAFANDLRDRLRDAERTLVTLRREVELENGNAN